VIVRAATPDDLPAILEIDADNPFAWSEASHTSAFDQAHQRCLVAQESAHVLGYAWISAVPTIGEGELLDVCVRAAARRRGVAAALLHAATDVWRSGGVGEVFLEVATDNTGAIALYRQFGWTDVAVRRRYYRDGRDALIMTRPLP
jgi:ribosomal-protein-alanine N-acetyltransferase